MVLACGGSRAPRPSQQYESAPSGPAPEAVEVAADADRGWFDFGGDEADGSIGKSMAKPAPMKAPSTPPRPLGQGAAEPKTEGMDKPLVVYLGYLKLRVRRLLEAVDAVTAKVQALGGYVESLSQRVVVVRVPAGDFDAAMAAFAEVGTVLSRRVKALDVTEKFTDLTGRLVVAKETRDRLLALLEQVTDTQERLRILQEVKRLTEQIESIESKLATLKNLVDFYTVTIELEPVVESRHNVTHRSPFGWVQRLAAHRESIDEGKGDFYLEAPRGFVLFDEDDIWRAQAADTTVMRAGKVENEPRGTSEWWSDAVRHEMVGRDEEGVDEGRAGRLAWRIFRNKDVQPRLYLVGVAASGEDLFVVEAFFPNEAAFERHKAAVLKALDGFRGGE